MLVVSNCLPINLHKLYGRNSISAPILAFSRISTRSRRFSMVTGSSSANSGDGAFTTLSERVTFEKEIKKSKFMAVACSVSDERSAFAFLSEVRQPRATHNCWAYKVGAQFRSNDDGEPSGTAGKPILSAIDSSGIDRVMVVVIRYFGGIKLGTGGLVRAYGGVAAECLRNAPTCVVKSKVPMGLEVPFDLLGVLYHQLQSFQAEDIKQDYETGKDNVTMVTFKVDFDRAQSLEEAIKASCSRDIVFYNHSSSIFITEKWRSPFHNSPFALLNPPIQKPSPSPPHVRPPSSPRKLHPSPSDSRVERSQDEEMMMEIKNAVRERGQSEEAGFLSGVAEEIREIEWPSFGKVLGTTGVVLGVIAGSSVVLLTVNAVLAELSDKLFIQS
ncbi:ribosomal protein S5 domain 2-like superfamily protein [Striga asiatica]|uniref:Ribosomal protein S5 domain 2-like superfamily protein n=1 Tax=Striga asiatica TaxID=4170 RepID=A0A5A7QVD5_STRAF|nr:ribosomal protein S5 domain 2-like superfamily protein [Striga asiatica]